MSSANDISALEEIAVEFDLVSFDVFDTLLVWPYPSPGDFLDGLEAALRLPGFAAARRAAVSKAYATARGAGREEVTLEEIYAHTPYPRHVMQSELDRVRRVVAADAAAAALWGRMKALGKKVVIASDMYYPEDFLKSLLESNGISGWDGFYLSCTQMTRKDSGGMFARIMDDFHVAPDKMLHIGDNRASDVEAPARLGAVGMPWARAIDVFLDENGFVKRFLEARHGGGDEGRSLAGAVAAEWQAMRAGGYWFRLGALAGGVMAYAYARWLRSHIESGGFTDVLFVARDGFVVKKILEGMGVAAKLRYVYAPRPVFAALTSDSGFSAAEVEMRRKWRVNLVNRRCGPISIDAARRYVETGMADDQLSAAIRRAADEANRDFRAYLGNECRVDGRACVVDGFSRSFSAQRLLSEFLGERLHAFYFAALSPCEDADAFLFAPKRIPAFWALGEFLFGAPHPTAEDVVDGRPVYGDVNSFCERRRVEVFEEVVAGAVDMAAGLSRRGLDVSNGTLADWMNAFAFNPQPEDRFHLEEVRGMALGKSYSIVPDRSRRVKWIRFLGIPLAKSVREWQGADNVRLLTLFGKIPILRRTYPAWA